VLPDAAESISYGVPTYKSGAVRVYLGAAKRHCAIYGAAPHLMADELQGMVGDKGTVRLPLNHPVDEALVRKLLEVTIAERTAARQR
jgi:uncharacterized protein YdhG (YjbR/CyaY superfamily)